MYFIGVILSLVLVRETYIYHVYILSMYIYFSYFKSFNTIYTPLSTLSHYALYHRMYCSFLMTHTCI